MSNKVHLGHTARKRFGQNFLTDEGVISSIVGAISPDNDHVMVEIGPGLGALTEPVADSIDNLTVVVLEVPPGCFTPPPKVDSAVVRLLPYEQKPWPCKDVTVMRHLCTTAFNMRRKTLRNNLKGMLDDDDFAALGIDSTLRPEQISVEQYVAMANLFIDKSTAN